jgi:hypothetical protein
MNKRVILLFAGVALLVLAAAAPVPLALMATAPSLAAAPF